MKIDKRKLQLITSDGAKEEEEDLDWNGSTILRRGRSYIKNLGSFSDAASPG